MCLNYLLPERDLLTPGKHPFHEHATVTLFLAFDGDIIKKAESLLF